MNFADQPGARAQAAGVAIAAALRCSSSAGFAVLAGRAVYLQGLHNDFLQAKGESRYSRVIEISANRGRITDRHGEVLAVSHAGEVDLGHPGRGAISTQPQLARLAALLEMPPQEIRKRIDERTAISSTSSARFRRRSPTAWPSCAFRACSRTASTAATTRAAR